MRKEHLRNKKLIVFDLDGTLAESKSVIDREMAGLLRKLLRQRIVAVIGGGLLAQFKVALLDRLHAPPRLLHNLFVFPTTAMAFYRYKNGTLKEVYSKKLTAPEKKQILRAFRVAFQKTKYLHPKKVYGKVIEDRKTQFTFSALGQDIVKVLGKKGIQEKEKWNKKDVRPELMRMMRPLLKKFEVRSGGLTSIDVTRKGIDKAYGVRKIRDTLHVPIREMLFVGDAIYPGGNDYAALKTGVGYVKVSGPKETKKVIRLLLG